MVHLVAVYRLTGCPLRLGKITPTPLRDPFKREVIKSGGNGLMADFFDTEAIANRVLDGLSQAELMQKLRRAAHGCAEKYSLNNGVGGYVRSLN